MKRIFLSFIFLSICNIISAQFIHPWEEYYNELTQAEQAQETLNEDAYELLCNLEEAPLNLNTATREDLERIPFLTPKQVEDIQAYVYQYHGLRSLGELSMIESLDMTRCQLLRYFVYVENAEEKSHFPTAKNILKYGKHNLIFTGQIPFYTRKGDRNGYLGYQYAHSFRYKFHYSDYLQVGLVGAKDAGEPFFTNGNPMGYDHYSFYIMARKMGRIKALALGRYKVKLGQGLILNTDFGFGKLANVANLERTTNIIRPHSSRSQANYLQGAAATVALSNHIDFTSFLSYRKIDATLTNNGAIQTILKSGYHRTPNEMNKKNNAAETIIGTNIQGRWQNFNLSFAGLYTHFNRPLQPNKNVKYRAFAPDGYNFWNISMSYGYVKPRWNISGEVATSSSGGVAMINNLSVRANNSLSFNLVQRHYGYQYNAIFSRGFSDGGHIQNETGLLIGADWQANRHLSLMAYTDFAYFPKPTFFTSKASHAWDNCILASYKVGKLDFSARYRLKIRQRDNKKKTFMETETMQRGRLSTTYHAEKWSAKTQIDMALNSFQQQSFGYMVSESAMWQPTKWLKTILNMGYFHTDDYASRLYVYEPNLLYSFTFPTYDGKGMRLCGVAQANITDQLIAVLKIGSTKYFDRKQIASSLQQINSSIKTDLELQIQWKIGK